MAIEKKLFEGFSKFFEEPTREHLRALLESNVGEIDLLDFKEIWPSKYKLAKHVLSFSNSGGGVLVVGVAENEGELTSVGLAELNDKADIEKSLTPYLPNGIKYEVLDFSYSASEYADLVGRSFQVMLIEHDSKRIPYLCKKSGDGLKDNVVYIRRGTSSTEATHDEVQKLINERIETGFSSSNVLELEEHLEQLKTLYSSTQKYKNMGLSIGLSSSAMMAFESMFSQEENPHYPKESFDEFIAGMIIKKKKRIQCILEVD
ncbi:hypothetical protein A3197_21555 [Candidatus Thiodiazotropha endoloripes]|nr:hypothetical protein A3197_21555 [Candidatus Thiodiazotropha endoloripes]